MIDPLFAPDAAMPPYHATIHFAVSTNFDAKWNYQFVGMVIDCRAFVGGLGPVLNPGRNGRTCKADKALVPNVDSFSSRCRVSTCGIRLFDARIEFSLLEFQVKARGYPFLGGLLGL